MYDYASSHGSSSNALIEHLTTQLDNEIRSVKKDMKQMVRSSGNMTPAIATKVAIDKDGLIVDTFPLTSDDIPMLPISKIDGLNETIERLQSAPPTKTIVNEAPPPEIKLPPIKVEDLPAIPMNKIEGLNEALVLIETEAREDNPNPLNMPPIEVVKFRDITMENIPRELTNQINAITTTLSSLATKESLDGFRKELSSKIEMNPPIEEGTYGVVKVDSHGLVVSGRDITVSDIPEIITEDIYELKRQMLRKANHDELVQLMNQFNLFANTISQLDLGNIKNQLAFKCDKDDLQKLSNTVAEINRKVENLVPVKPVDGIQAEIKSLQSQISSLAGTIVLLQQKVAALTHIA